MAYDYIEALKADITEWIDNNLDYMLEEIDEPNRETAEQYLYDTLWTEDSVTGNASGSYTFNRAKAKEYVLANIDLAGEALTEFGYNAKHLGEKIQGGEWEYLDVTIRCYLLGQAIAEVLDEKEEELFTE